MATSVELDDKAWQTPRILSKATKKTLTVSATEAEMHTTAKEPVSRSELRELGEPQSGLVIIEGPPGSGKTTLLDELTQRLGKGRTVLSAGCGRLGSGHPSGLIGQA